MKKANSGLLSKAAFLALAAISVSLPARAQLTVTGSGYGVDTYYTHTNSDHIISYDWDANENLYYMTTPADFSGGTAVWKSSGGSPTSLYANGSTFAGASVVTIGNYVYFNDSDLSGNQTIHDFGPLNGTPSVNAISTTPNYALFGHNGNLFIAGATASSHIYYTPLNEDGTLTNNPAVSIANVSGGSGPLVFDAAGNLYYAPGFSDLSIYKWTASEVAGALANPSTAALNSTGHLWLDYSGLYPDVSGGTSMLLDGSGDLLLTLTNFSGPSSLASFGINPDGSYDGVDTTILTDTGLLGELRSHDGGTYMSADNEIVQIVPEPGSCLLAGAGLSILLTRRSRKPARRNRR
jgi:hypothetical protein